MRLMNALEDMAVTAVETEKDADISVADSELHERMINMKEKTILIDADDVLENLSQEWVKLLNEKYGTHTTYDDVIEWDMSKAFPTLSPEQVYEVGCDEDLYYRLQPLPGAVEYVGRLISDGHKVYIVTNTPYQVIKVKMEEGIFKYFPYLTWENMILTTNKQMIRGDILIDDGIHNLEGGNYDKILVSTPYNASYDAEANGMIRVHSWEEIYCKVCELAK